MKADNPNIILTCPHCDKVIYQVCTLTSFKGQIEYCLNFLEHVEYCGRCK